MTWPRAARALVRLAGIGAAGGMLAMLCLPAAAQESSPGGRPAGAEEVPPISVHLDTLTFLEGKKGDIEVLQLLRVVNEGGRPYLGEPVDVAAGDAAQAPRRVFRIPVPEGAFDIAPSELSNPQGMAEGPAGIFTTVPLPPGETLISFIYRVRPARSGWALRREIDYPTRSINLLLGPGLELQGAPGFRLTERKKLGETEYRRFRAGPFSPGSVLTADVAFEGEAPSNLWAGFASAAAALTALGLGLALLVRRRSSGARNKKISMAGGDKSGTGGAGQRSGNAERREDLITQIALLDEEFDSGSISEAAYQNRRRELKTELALLSESLHR